ncbi:MAG: hypothetical protein COW40_08230 [Cytophagales bacterium CG17_big_fil_post_rev_8_21_14_2_50_40_13]|nr:MAG: hypothetical protein COW40_08230 [Cytophagales bacterium CG17_big_fil_post_rev_8_21_14_2_50_40_13]
MVEQKALFPDLLLVKTLGVDIVQHVDDLEQLAFDVGKVVAVVGFYKFCHWGKLFKAFWVFHAVAFKVGGTG